MKIVLLFCFLFLTSCEETVLRVKSEIEANRVMFSLRDNGIEAKKSLDATDWLIKVKSKEFTDALRVLETKRLYNKLLVDKGQSEKGADIFSSRSEKQSQLLEKLSRELSATILLFPGVVDARVHIHKKSQDPLTPETLSDSASVLIITEGAPQLDHNQFKLVVSKGGGVPFDAVVVVEQQAPQREKQALVSAAKNIRPSFSDQLFKEARKQKLYVLGSLIITTFFATYWGTKLRARSRQRAEMEMLSRMREN